MKNGFPFEQLLGGLDPEVRTALFAAASTPTGARLISTLAQRFQIDPALLDVFEEWTAQSRDIDMTVVREADADGDTYYASVESAAVERLRREVRELRNVNDNLAAALGACPVCWGADEACVECDGCGTAGSLSPDPALFKALVAPAVKRVETNRVRRLRYAGHRDVGHW